MVMLRNGNFSLAKNVRILGSGKKTVILAHGYGGEQYVWDKILPHLAKTHRVIVFDWDFSGPTGDSSLVSGPPIYSSFDAFSDELISLVESLGLSGSIVYVGHSMSGMIGCLASIQRPDLFERLVMVGSSPRYLNAQGYDGGFEREDVDKILYHIQTNFQAWAVNFASMVVDRKDPVSVEKFGSSLRRMRPEIALSLAKTVFLGDHRSVLEKVEVPCTIFQCTSDPVVPMSVAYFMQKKMKGKAKIEVIEADGHFPQLTSHESFISVLDKILSL